MSKAKTTFYFFFAGFDGGGREVLEVFAQEEGR
jgi:hypothetical protein